MNTLSKLLFLLFTGSMDRSIQHKNMRFITRDSWVGRDSSIVNALDCLRKLSYMCDEIRGTGLCRTILATFL